MPSEDDKWILNQIADAIVRKDQRNWAGNPQETRMAVDSAVAKVAEVLRDQWRSSPAPDDLGYEFYTGLLSVDFYFTDFPPREEELDMAIQQAENDYYAFLTLRFLISLGVPDSLPSLRLWGRKVAAGTVRQPQRPKGPTKFANIWRDHLLLGQINNLKAAGFLPTRNAATGAEESACDIVSKATHQIGEGRGMTYTAVEGIWRRQERLIRLITLPRCLAEFLASTLHLGKN